MRARSSMRWVAALGIAACAAAFVAPVGADMLSSIGSTLARKGVVRTEHLTGADAAAYLARVLAADPEFARVHAEHEADLARRGFKKTGIVTVMRTYRSEGLAAKAIRTLAPVLLAQTYSESSGEGEIIASAWDDGNADNWEGTFYARRYSDGQWVENEIQLDESSEDTANDAQQIWSSVRSDGGGCRPCPLDEARANGGRIVLARQQHPCGLDNWCRASYWATCTRRGCVGVAIGCLRSGPGWLPCFGAWCTGVQVACAMQHWF